MMLATSLGFLQATVHFALERPELAASFSNYLMDVVRGFEQGAASAITGEQVAVSQLDAERGR